MGGSDAAAASSSARKRRVRDRTAPGLLATLSGSRSTSSSTSSGGAPGAGAIQAWRRPRLASSATIICSCSTPSACVVSAATDFRSTGSEHSTPFGARKATAVSVAECSAANSS
jgi:hypothetical protein